MGIDDDWLADEVADGLLLVCAFVSRSLCFDLLACECAWTETMVALTTDETCLVRGCSRAEWVVNGVGHMLVEASQLQGLGLVECASLQVLGRTCVETHTVVKRNSFRHLWIKLGSLLHQAVLEGCLLELELLLG